MADKIIHIEWEGLFTLEEISTMNKEGYDHGIYQIYGSHTVYGLKSLLYIGQTQHQTFSERLAQEGWDLTWDGQTNAEVRVGRLAGIKTPSRLKWDEEIGLAEILLIAAHTPAYNRRYILGASLEEQKKLLSVHILNWGNRGMLLPEVSGAVWTSKFNEIEGYHVYGSEQLEE